VADRVTITAVWLRRIGDHAEVLVEIDGQWRLVTRERFDGLFSHIAEARGAACWERDALDVAEGVEHVC